MITDSTLADDVEAELAWEPVVNPGTSGVSVKDGAVTLPGYPATWGSA